MVTKAITATTVGIDAYKIEVEVDISNSLPGISIVGLPDNAVNEARERVHSAIKNSGFTFPLGKVIVNLAPAVIRKEGTNFDLPIAIGILKEQGINIPDDLTMAFIGELSLDGSLRRVNGVLSLVAGLKENGITSTGTYVTASKVDIHDTNAQNYTSTDDTEAMTYRVSLFNSLTADFFNFDDLEKIYEKDIEDGCNQYISIEALKKLYEEETGHTSTVHKYYVLRWNEPSNLIPAHLYKDGLRHIHPDSDQARTITVREAARLQTFPDDYVFIGSQMDQYKMIGNAVPPAMSKIIAEVIYELLFATK